MTVRLGTCAAALLLLASAAQAQTMKPGLWEVRGKGPPEMAEAMSKMRERMANMPPAQRKQMEEMMAKQGAGMSGAPGDGFSVKTCVTKEMASRMQLPVQQQGNCTTTTNKTSAGMKMKFTCTDPQSSGEGDFTFSGDTAYTMKLKINPSGEDKSRTFDATGKWLGSDCGAVKPPPEPKKH